MAAARDELRNEIADLPEPYAREVLDFVRFLKARIATSAETAITSEHMLSEDWLKPEEDEAWADL